MRNKGLIASLTVAVVAMAAALVTVLVQPRDDPAAPRTMNVAGNITLTTTDVYYLTGTLGEECYGTSQWRDMVKGAQVTVSDGAGTVLATGKLQQGRWYDSCVFSFTVTEVPEHPVLQVEVAGHGKVAFELDQVKNGGVKLTLGP